jgi:uncharacterized radical SAM superfamily Fe-S cluster-containing enzyme
MSEIVLAAGSVAGVFTAIAIDKVTQFNVKSRQNENLARKDREHLELERRVVYEAMRRVYDYERVGRITSAEREKLLARYREQLDTFNAQMVNFRIGNDVSSFKTDLIALVDQRMMQINAKLDLLTNRIDMASDRPLVSTFEKKEERKLQKTVETVVQNKADHVIPTENVETSESDASLDEIKKQIMQTLSRLEQAEVE